MQIVLVADHAYINGGQAKVVVESALGLAARGHAVTVFAAVGPADPRLAAADVAVVLTEQADVTSTNSLARFGAQWLWNRTAAERLRALLAGLDPRASVVHIHGWAKALSPSIGPVLRGCGLPVVFTLHEYYLACPNGGFYDYPVAAPCQRAPGSPACLAHNCDSRSYARKLMRVGRHWLMQGTGLARSADAVITISRLQRAAMAPYLPADTRFAEVGNPVDVAPLGHRTGAPGGFVFVGRISPEKGPLLFAEAARRAGCPATFVGDGPQADEIRARYPEAQILGWKTPAEVHALMREARALVFPSVWYEGQPLTVLEAQALGLPVIVSDVCAGREAVADGVTGLWFRSGDADALAEAMRRLTDDALARTMSDAAYDRFWADPLTLDRHLDGLDGVYAGVMREAGTGVAGLGSYRSGTFGAALR